MNFYEKFNELCREIKKTPTGVGIELGINRSTVSYWKYGHTPKEKTIKKIADYFDVSTDYLLGNTDIKNPPERQNPEDIAKSVLFGTCEVTDEMWESIKAYAEFIKQQKSVY